MRVSVMVECRKHPNMSNSSHSRRKQAQLSICDSQTSLAAFSAGRTLRNIAELRLCCHLALSRQHDPRVDARLEPPALTAVKTASKRALGVLIHIRLSIRAVRMLRHFAASVGALARQNASRPLLETAVANHKWVPAFWQAASRLQHAVRLSCVALAHCCALSP
jgi:hypothetical protein